MNPWFEGAQKPQPGTLNVVEVIDLEHAHQAWELLDAHRGSGWICTTGRVVRVPTDHDLHGEPPLSAEIATLDGRSLHLRQHQRGWRAWILEDQLGQGSELSIDERFLSTEGRSYLLYRTWWRLEPERGVEVWKPYASRFLGWEDGR